MKKKRILTGILVLSMVMGTVSPAAPLTVQAASNLESGYQNPWSNTEIPSLASKQSANVNATKFTHKEWTGTEYQDVDGSTVKGADVYAINREESSMFASTSVVYDTVENAITGARDYKKDASKYVQFLTGANAADWSLVVLQNQDLAQGAAYADFYKTTYTPSAANNWKTGLQLPCSWTGQGFDFSIYTNVQMPWQSKYDSNVTVPEAPVVYNPVGLYRKTFKVNDALRTSGGRIYLSFQGVESAYYVYVNGKEVGYSEDSYSPHSFDVTDYLNAATEDNLLAVEVHKFCDGTWMEDQDMFYDGGIFRDIYLYSAPLVHIQDYKVETDLDANYENAQLKLNVTVANASTSAVSDYKVDAKLYDENGNVFVNGITLDLGTIAGATDGIDGKASATATKLVTAPKLWSAETPNLYTLVLSVYDSKTKAYLGSVSQQLGFREIEFVSTKVDENGNRTTQDSEYTPITINGKPLLFKGVNRHDTDPVYGKHVPQETQEEDVKLMKQYNINAIRTGHYSNDEYLYYLCDKYGLYMMAETNLESHALMGDGNAQKNFKNLAMDRTITAFNRLKNRTAVVSWSTGNENYVSDWKGYADGMFYDLIWYFKNNDTTRPVHCQSSYKDSGVDMTSQMYPSVRTVKAHAAQNMPYVMCEYDHAMGNAVGNLKEYWDAVRSSDNMLGGFIWDWVDQSRLISLDTVSGTPYDYYAEDYAHKNLYKEEAVGKYYCYGGDSGELPNDNSFCVNGLVSPDRDVQPELYEVKYQYQGVWFDATDAQLNSGTIKVYNENNFLNLNDFDVKWTLTEDAKVIGSGTLTDVNVAGRETSYITVPYREALPKVKKAGAEYYLKLSVQLKEETLWAKAGHEVAYEQFQIPVEVARVEKSIDTNVTVDETQSNVITVSGNGFSFQIDKSTGAIKNYVYGSDTLLTEGPVPNYWRALLNNDNANYDGNWQNVNKGVKASKITIGTNEDGQTTITVKLVSSVKNTLKQTMVYTVDGNGAVTVNMTVDATAIGLGRYLRIGTVMELPAGYENVEWYGNGPVEAMWDRENFAVVDKYQTTVSKMFYPYLDTQDTGTVTGVKWITVTNPSASSAMAIATTDKLEASALHFTVDDLTQAQHPYELTKLDSTILTVNYRSQGTGNKSCGEDTLSAYLLPNDHEYSFEYTMIPYVTENADVMEVTRAYRKSATKKELEDAAVAKLIHQIDSILVTDSDTTELNELKKTYEGLSEEAKEKVTAARYEKILEALELAELLKDSNKTLMVEDKSKNGFDLDISAQSQAVLELNDGIKNFKGQTSVSDDNFDRLFSGTTPFTIEAVVNPNSYGYGGTDYNMIASKGDACAAFRISEQAVYFFIHNTSNEWKTVKVGLSDEEMSSWLHVAAIYDGANISVYVEGKEVVTTTGVGAITGSTYPLGIGYCPEKGRSSMAGIRELHVYSEALTKDELDNRSVAADSDVTRLWYDFNDAVYTNVDMNPTGIRSYISSLGLQPGETAQIRVEAKPYYAKTTAEYTPSNTKVVTVDKTGLVTAVGKGATSIIAKLTGTDFKTEISVFVGETANTPYTQAEVEEFKLSGTYPVKEGYVFAGWYRDAACTTPVTDTIPDKAYPKFVEEQILTMRGQLPANITAESQTADLRLITAVDSTKYKRIGFTLQIGETNINLGSSTVYRTLTGYVDSMEQQYNPADVFGSSAVYFATANIINIPASDFNTPFTVTPYWVTLDGTTVTGTARTWTIDLAMPVKLNVNFDKTESTQRATAGNLSIEVGGDFNTQLIVNGDKLNAKDLSLQYDSATGTYWTRVYIKDMINDLKLGENTFTVRVTKTDDAGGSYITEKTASYNNTGFLYVRDPKGTLETVFEDGEPILKYTDNNGDWTGLGSHYISFVEGTNNWQGGFATEGVKYMTMKVKLTSNLKIYYGCPNTESENSVEATLTADQTSVYLENRGVQGTLKANEWVTVKIPLKTTNPEAPYRNFTIQPTDGGVLYIKDVRYETSDYVAPMEMLKAKYENGNSYLGNIRIDASENVPVEIVVNGDESQKFSVTLMDNPDKTAGSGKYAQWYGMQKLASAMKIGDNTLTIRATKTEGSGQLVAEYDVLYFYQGFLYVRDNSGEAILESETDGGETVLKYTDGTDWRGLGSSYISNPKNGTNDDAPQAGKFASEGVTYMTMQVKLVSGSKLNIFYDSLGDAGDVNKNILIGESSPYLDNKGVQETLKKNEWVTVKIPLKASGTEGYCNFTIRAVKSDTEKGILYIKDVRYEKDAYIAPLAALEAKVNYTDSRDELEIKCGEALPVEVIVNGDESKKFSVGDLSYSDWHGAYMAWYNLSSILNELHIGTNTLTIRATKTVGSSQLVSEYNLTYTNTGYLYAANGVLETVKDGGEDVLKYTVDTAQVYDGVHSQYIQIKGGNTPGKFSSDGIQYISMKVKLQDAASLYLNFHGSVNKEIKVGTADSEYLNGNTLNLNEWVEVKMPVGFTVTNWVNCYVTAHWNDGQNPILYIKDVKYLKN